MRESNTIKLKVTAATATDSSPGSFRDDAAVKFYFKGDRHTAARLEKAIIKALHKEVQDA